MRKMILPLLALLGILFTLFMIYRGIKQSPVAPILYVPPVPPYSHFVAGVGIVESVYKNIPIGIAIADIIHDIPVKVGDVVSKGAPLFTLDTRSLRAQLNEAEQYLRYSIINYEDKKTEFSFYERLDNTAAVSEQAYAQALFQMQLAQQQVENARAAVKLIQTNIERSTARAPIDGEILQLNIRVGQFVGGTAQDLQPLILFGDTVYYHLRIDIDEEDAWRIIKGSPATAFVRGNASISIPLEYVYTEPYIIPKQTLSGADTERVDTRVLQVVYRFEKNSYPVYAGLLLDVYLEALPSREAPCA